MNLFQDGEFVGHAGLPLSWKIECDAISNKEWRCLAKMIMEYQIKPFSKAEGIPRGGVALGDALNEYATGNPDHPVLVADDVYTTGTSFKDYKKLFIQMNLYINGVYLQGAMLQMELMHYLQCRRKNENFNYRK